MEDLALREAERQYREADDDEDSLGFGQSLEGTTRWLRSQEEKKSRSRQRNQRRDPNLGREEDGPQITNYAPQSTESEVAEDGQTLLLQTPWTQQAFRTRYGARAGIEWAKEHNEELKKNRITYGVAEPKPGQKSLAGSSTQVAPDRTIGKAEPPEVPSYTPPNVSTTPTGNTRTTPAGGVITIATTGVGVNNTDVRYAPNDTLEILDPLSNQIVRLTGAQWDEQKKRYPELNSTRVIEKVIQPGTTTVQAPTTLSPIQKLPDTGQPVAQQTMPERTERPTQPMPQDGREYVWVDLGPLGKAWRTRGWTELNPSYPVLYDPQPVQKLSNRITAQDVGVVPTQAPINIGTNPVNELAQLSIRAKNGGPADVKAEEIRILQGVGGLLRGEKGNEWAESYLNDVARIAWARESQTQGKTVDPRQAPLDYIERWKDAFYGSDHSVPLVRDLDQQMIDNAVNRISTGQTVFDWQQAFGENGENGLISRQVASNDCGPNAFANVLRSRGYNADPAAAFEYAKQQGWHNGDQFTGSYRMAEMLRKEAGLDAETRPMDWKAVDAELDAKRPVTLSSGGHYWTVSAYRDGPQGREYYTGATGAVVGNPEWARPEQIQYGGSPNYMITAKGPVDPNAPGIQALGLRPPGPQSSRANLSRMTSRIIYPPEPNPATIGNYGENIQGLIETDNPVGQYIPLIEASAQTNQVDPLLVAAIAEVESQGDATARSSQGAGGVMQLMGSTARALGVTDVDDPRQNIEGGARYIREQLDQFDGDLDLALAAYNCFDDQTELLVKDSEEFLSWKFFSELDDTDRVGSYNIQTGAIEFSLPIATQIFPYSGNMCHFQSRGVDIRVTPNHRMLFGDRRSGVLKFGLANQYISSPGILISAVEHAVEYPLTDDQLRIAAWVLTDGSINYSSKCWRVFIYQRASKVHFITSVLDRLGWEYSLRQMNLSVTEIGGRSLIKPHEDIVHVRLYKSSRDSLFEFLRYKTTIPDWVFKLSGKQFNTFLEAYISGDGNSLHGKEVYHRSITGNPLMMDQLQIAAIMNGHRATIVVPPKGNYVRLNIRLNMALTRTKFVKEFYNGFVYCVTTTNGTVVTRRNGCVAITGNSGPGAVLTYGGVPPYSETKEYIRKVKARYQQLKDMRNQVLAQPTGGF